VGWSKADMEELSKKIAAMSNTIPAKIFGADEKVPEFKPG
jgi:hypothetical protein